ncbi:transglycosylase domain-containing protein [Agromyces aerolatus]|uniref:transglycosylase domain-containing protein n=1 Tax=Agromyces sp. LY-1074 TaxID=3074080 RepID=UPI00286408E0|nr:MULTISPECIES: transglycosylase domain-containing protein [unclassified Agromyces]MDR5701505.1 transglycosylase domain-containing protein [Agromyces sp. LY-1074]MDR5704428.1 transglycosylase domain-containing protein [Agromyces sp. LY-1358]
MSAQKRSMSAAATGFAGFVGMSALAGVLVTAAVTPALAVTGMAASNSITMFENLPGYLDISELSEKTDIYATNSEGATVPLASFFSENREAVPWDRISQYVKDSAIAGEDPRFYEHGGVDIQGTMRAFLNEYVIGGATQGGSSITQQYVKNVLINNGVREAQTEEEKQAAYDEATETTPERKLKEMRYAIALEKKYSKDDILLGYLNIAAFGGRVYGIEAAAQYYFSKSAADVSLPEAASLIAIVNHPEKFRLDMPEDAENGAATVNEAGEPVPYAANKERRDYILNEMLKYGKITQEEYDGAVATPVTPVVTPPSTGCQTAGGSAFFCDYVRTTILNHYDDPATEDVNEGLRLLNEGGLQVYTTLDLELQVTAENTIRENVPFVDPRFDVGSVAVSVQPGTGRVLAMAQNKNYSADPEVAAADPSYTSVNYSTDFENGGSSGLQPGSTYKVFTLAEWLNEGHSLLESFNGSRRAFTSFTDSCNGNWFGNFNPRNDDGRIANNAVNATAWSVNTSFMAMAQQLDLCKIKQTAQAFGIHRADGNDLQMNPSDVLGTQEVAPVTMAAAFAGIANNGLTCSPIVIDRIVKADGTEIQPPQSACTQSVTPEVSHAMAYAMQQTFAGGGTATAANPYTGIDHIGKTGTTDGAKDTWMIGSSTKVATAVWVGNVVNDANLRSLSFDSGPAATARHRMWSTIMERADTKYGGDAFPEPESTAFRQVLIDIPQVTGLSFEDAKQALEEAGFQVEDGGQQDSSQPAGTVSGTDPSGQAGRGSLIRVFTSNGQGTTVPDLTGMTQQQAKSALDQAGLKLQGNGQGNQVVTAQNPAPNTAVRRDTAVQVTFGGGGQNGNGDD